MTVKEVFLKALCAANVNRNNWVKVIKTEELNHCYITNSGYNADSVSFTMFIGDGNEVLLIRPLSNQIGISIDSGMFIYTDAIRIVDMHARDEFVITKDGII